MEYCVNIQIEEIYIIAAHFQEYLYYNYISKYNNSFHLKIITWVANVSNVHICEQFMSQAHDTYEKSIKWGVGSPGSISSQLYTFDQDLSLQILPSDSYDCENLNKHNQ